VQYPLPATKIIVHLAMCVATIVPLYAVVYQQAYIKASNTEAGDFFGASVAISGDTLVVGADREASKFTGINTDPANNESKNAGAAYVYVRSGKQWIFQAYLKASNTGTGDRFGAAVAIYGDTIVVGAPYEDSAATGVNGDQVSETAGSSGAAYVFVRNGTNWSQQAYLKASNTSWPDLFGSAVAIHNNTVVIGAREESSSGVGVNGTQNGQSGATYKSGAAYVFVRDGETWTQQAYLKASNPGGGEQFGYSLAVSGDTIIVGAINEGSGATGMNGNQQDESAPSSGAAYIFVRSSGTWIQQAYVKASNTHTGDSFGRSVAIDGETALVGANYESSKAAGVNGDQSDVSLWRAGAVYVFIRDKDTWLQQAYLKASNPLWSGYFGEALAISGDSVVVTANGDDSGSAGVNGDQLNANALNSGAAYTFFRKGTNWVQTAYVKASNPGGQISGALIQDGDHFGTSVSMSVDTIAIASAAEDSNSTGVNGSQTNNLATDSGAVYVFRGAAPPSLAPRILSAIRTQSDFIFDFSSDPYLEGWIVDGYPILDGSSVDLTFSTAISELTPGYYRAKFTTPSKRYFLWISR
jgi:hypothetical protein